MFTFCGVTDSPFFYRFCVHGHRDLSFGFRSARHCICSVAQQGRYCTVCCHDIPPGVGGVPLHVLPSPRPSLGRPVPQVSRLTPRPEPPKGVRAARRLSRLLQTLRQEAGVRAPVRESREKETSGQSGQQPPRDGVNTSMSIRMQSSVFSESRLRFVTIGRIGCCRSAIQSTMQLCILNYSLT